MMNRLRGIVIFFLLLNFAGQSQNLAIDSLKKLVSLAGNDTLKAKSLAELSWEYVKTGNYAEGVKLATEGLEISSRLSMKSTTATLYNNIGLAQYRTGKFSSALDYFNRELKIGLSIGNNKVITYAYSNLGMIYDDLKEHGKALAYYKLAITYFDKDQSMIPLANNYNNIGSIFQEINQPDSALKYFSEALKIKLACNDVLGTANTINNIGVIYYLKKDITKAIGQFLRALKLKRQVADTRGIISICNNLGGLYGELHKYQAGIKYLLEAEMLAEQRGINPDLLDTYKNLSAIYTDLDMKKAYKYHIKEDSVKDLLFGFEKNKELMRVEAKYEFDKKEMELKMAQARERESAEMRAERQKFLFFSSLILFIMIIVVVFIVYRNSKVKMSLGALALEQKMLRTQMNPHFIFNSLQAIQNFILKQDTKESVKYLSSFANLSRAVLESSRVEEISLSHELTMLNQYLSLQKLCYGNRFDFEIICEEIDPEDTPIPPMLAQPFIENAVEHGMKNVESGGHIEVRFSKKNDCIFIEVTDNGKGLINQSSGKAYKSLATTITKERIDLLNRTRKRKAVFTMQNAFPGKKNVGVHVTICIPIASQ